MYIEQCCKMFDYWMYDCINPVKLQPYYTYLRDIVENTSSGCQRTSCLGRWIALYPNGDIYLCVRENRLEYRYGNILNIEQVDSIWETHMFRKLLDTAVAKREKCRGCQVYQYCHGGCPINMVTNNGDFACKTFKEFFLYVLNKYNNVICKMDYGTRKASLNPWIMELLK